jgi:hypothetical protein
MDLCSLLIVAFGGRSQGFSRAADQQVGMCHPCQRYLIYRLYEIIAPKAENKEAWHKRPTADVVQTKSLLDAAKYSTLCAAQGIIGIYVPSPRILPSTDVLAGHQAGIFSGAKPGLWGLRTIDHPDGLNILNEK